MDSILTLDVGSSSARTLLFTLEGAPIDGFGTQVPYRAEVTEDGGWEVQPKTLLDVVTQSLDGICAQLRAKNITPHAVAVDTFWHSILGVAVDDEAVTPMLHPFDSRSTSAAKTLSSRIDNVKQHSRTGCMLHPSYPPAKILWFAQTQPDAFRQSTRWMSVGEYIFLKFFKTPAASTSMISACGLWDQNRNAYDDEVLAGLPITRAQLAPPEHMDQTCQGLRNGFEDRWPELNNIPWYPALGDGACDSIGSGCIARDRWSLMVGTSGALRCTIAADSIDIAPGLFCYRIDRGRFVSGGALSNGGAVYAWMKRTLLLPTDAEIEKQLADVQPGTHELTVLPLLSGERSPEWRLDTSAAMTGLHVATTAVEILHAALEAVALRFRNVYEMMEAAFGTPREIAASGSALVHSPAWTRMIVDAMGSPVRMCLEPEATSRGAALLALERMGCIRDIAAAEPPFAPALQPDLSKKDAYLAALNRQRGFYTRLFEET